MTTVSWLTHTSEYSPDTAILKNGDQSKRHTLQTRQGTHRRLLEHQMGSWHSPQRTSWSSAVGRSAGCLRVGNDRYYLLQQTETVRVRCEIVTLVRTMWIYGLLVIVMHFEPPFLGVAVNVVYIPMCVVHHDALLSSMCTWAWLVQSWSIQRKLVTTAPNLLYYYFWRWWWCMTNYFSTAITTVHVLIYNPIHIIAVHFLQSHSIYIGNKPFKYGSISPV